jgi:plasmid stabilization system protein ParE
MRIEILDDAKDDLIDGFHFYEEQSTGLGSYFLDSLFADIDSLLLYAGVHRMVHGSHRFIARRFPFAIYYRIENDVVRVRAVIDCRRSPIWIRRRLQHPSA